MILFLIFAKDDSPTIFLPRFYYGSPEKLIFKSESYSRDDSFLFARPPPLRGINPPPNVARQIKIQTVLTITEERRSIDKTENDRDDKIMGTIEYV